MQSTLDFLAKGIAKPKIIFLMHIINDLALLIKTEATDAPLQRKTIIDENIIEHDIQKFFLTFMIFLEK